MSNYDVVVNNGGPPMIIVDIIALGVCMLLVIGVIVLVWLYCRRDKQ